MVDDSNVKNLGRVLVIVFIIIFLIIMLYLIEHFFSVDSHGYVIPSTTKPISEEYDELSDEDKIKYNNEINNNKITYILNNTIIGMFEYYNINLIQNEKVKFKYLYSYSYFVDNKDGLTYEEVVNYSNRIFNIYISKNNYYEFLVDDLFKLDLNVNSPNFCLKTRSVKESNDELIYLYDYINYNEDICEANNINYDNNIVSKQMLIRMLKNGENKYIDSITMIKKEG